MSSVSQIPTVTQNIKVHPIDWFCGAQKVSYLPPCFGPPDCPNMPLRHCSVEISNKSASYTLANPRVFIENGHCEVSLPTMMGPCSNATALFNKTTGAATGAVGVFTYDLLNLDLGDYEHVMAVMYSVPFDRHIYSNWVAVGIFEKGSPCDYNLYNTMYSGSENNFVRVKGDGSTVSFEGDYVIVAASMSETGEAVLKLEIRDTGFN